MKSGENSPGDKNHLIDLKGQHSIQYQDSPYSNWYELRFHAVGPDRRGYHSTFVHNKRLYIYGGHDIREGSKDSLWTLDLKKLRDMEVEPSQQVRDCMWKI